MKKQYTAPLAKLVLVKCNQTILTGSVAVGLNTYSGTSNWADNSESLSRDNAWDIWGGDEE